MNQSRHPAMQSGFTLIEVLVASVVGLFLIAVLFQLLIEAAHLTDITVTRIQINDEARQMMSMLGAGGAVDADSSGTIAASEVLAGLHGAANLTVAGSNVLLAPDTTLARNGQRLRFSRGNGNFVESSEVSISLPCTAIDAPHPDCTGAGTLAVSGYLASNLSTSVIMTVADRCAGNTTAVAAVELDIVDPRGAYRSDDFASADFRSRFHGVFGLNVDCTQ